MPVTVFEAAVSRLDTDQMAEACEPNGYRAPELTQALLQQAVASPVLAALDALDEQWSLPTVLGITQEQLAQAMRPIAVGHLLDDAEQDVTGRAEMLFRGLIVRGPVDLLRSDSDRRWFAAMLRAYATLIEQASVDARAKGN